jgi:hypothetical protein
MIKKVFFIGVFLTVFGVSTLVNAALQDNGNNLVYDTDRNITWYNPTVSDMNWNQAIAWAEGLAAGGVTGWRLPSALNQDGSYPYYGYGVVESELGHLYYEELDNATYGPLVDTEPFSNMQPIIYWSSTVTAQYAGNAFVFNFSDGRQAHANKNLTANFSAIAVHSGNVCTPVGIDVEPWNKGNPIKYKRGHGIVPVTILSTKDFDAPREMDQDSLTFGATGNEQSLAFCEHRLRDGKRDRFNEGLVCHFYIEKTGFNCGDTEGILRGKTFKGIVVKGEDLVRIIHCK